MRGSLIPGRDRAQKLDQTYCRYKGIPVWVRIDGQAIYIYDSIKQDQVQKIEADDPNFDISSIPLGYVNTKEHTVYYLSRTPIRRVKQGLASNSLRLHSLPDSVKPRNHNAAMILQSQNFVDMVTQKYPSLEEALSKIRKLSAKDSSQMYQVAISRDIALSIDAQYIVRVYYKNEYVGWIEPEKFIVRVKKSALSWVISKYLSHVLGWQID